jgi:acyl transferase domain-containing protein/SAM-dependent methyltransferase
MSDSSSSAIKRALSEIRMLRGELAKVTYGVRAPLAIIGMALRLPGGVHSSADFERLLFSGEDPIHNIPADRWPIEAFYSADPDAPGKMTTRQGGFLDGVDRFDAAFFGISPAEATTIDPQQRLLLELAWEAVENAGVGFDTLRAVRTGVYIGLSNSDYGRAVLARHESINAYAATGAATSVAAGRVSYALDLTGPALVVDTACSASLASLHLACQALRLGECDAALVGGANLILTPEINLCFTKGHMMSAEDRCRTFDAGADGYVRSEGVVMFLVKRLRDAEADGDRILAIVRGSALNQDGRSSGLTAPSGPAQQAVIRAALDNAGVAPGSIGYVEAHGTGTPLGDPIELGALADVFAASRTDERPLLVGAVKSTIGHAEAAAGAAGVAKCLVAFARGELPPNLHFDRATPHVDLQASRLAVVDKPVALPRDAEGRCLVGVSSFGISGTNAHVVLEAPSPVPAVARPMERPAHILALSAKSRAALRDLGDAWRTDFARTEAIADLCYTANVGRARLEHHAVIVGRSRGDFTYALGALHEGREASGMLAGDRAEVPPRIAFLFTGQGAHFPGMGKPLYDTAPVFRDSLDACAAAAAPLLGRDLREALFVSDPASLADPLVIQPANFALQVALAALWRAWGVEPAVMLGHSLGEYAAAYAAGVFSLSDAMRLVVARGRGAALCHGRGAMVAVSAPQELVQHAIDDLGDLEFAAYNGTRDFVVSGTPASIAALARRIECEDGRAKMLAVPFGSHARWVEPALPALAEALGETDFKPAQIELANNLTGEIGDARSMSNTAYWRAQMRQPVRFREALERLAARGITHFIEIGPHPVLSAQGLENLGDGFAWLASMRRDGDPWSDLLTSLQRLSVDGAAIDWRGFDAGYGRLRVTAPTYPFERRRHWQDCSPPAKASAEQMWTRATTAARRQSEQGPLELDMGSYAGKWDLLARLTEAMTLAALRDAGLYLQPEQFAEAALLNRLRIAPAFVPLVTRWLARLVDSGTLKRHGDVYRAEAALPRPDLDALWAEMGVRFSDDKPLLAYVRRCGELAGDVVTGRESALETLFPGGSFALAEDLYQRSPSSQYVNAILAAAVAAFAAGSPRSLRILEIGAGTGAGTAAVLPLLDRSHIYTLSDVSDAFLSFARERFSGFDNVRFATFDLDREIEDQGCVEAQFDLIISVNAVHASANLQASLARLKRLLAPGGMIALVESTTAFAWFDFTTGLIEGWRQHMDALRKDGPLLGAGAWTEALRETGFVDASHFPGSGAPANILGQHLVLARKGGEQGSGAIASWSEATETMRAPAPAEPAPAASVVEDLAQATPVERIDVMRAFVRGHVRALLGLTEEGAPDRKARLTDLGFDSLMAVQLRNRLTRGLGLEKPLPASTMFDHPSVDALSLALLKIVAPPAAVSVGAPASSPKLVSTDVVAEMSDADIAALLAERMEPRK